jgi:hypothetical protein
MPRPYQRDIPRNYDEFNWRACKNDRNFDPARFKFCKIPLLLTWYNSYSVKLIVFAQFHQDSTTQAKQLHVDMQLTASPSRPLTARPTSAVIVSNPIINRPPVQKPALIPVASNVVKRPRDRVRPAEVAKPLIPVVSRPQLIMVQPIIPSVKPTAPVSANVANAVVPPKPVQSVVPAVQSVATPSRKPSIQDLRQANNNNQPVRPMSAALPSARSVRTN